MTKFRLLHAALHQPSFTDAIGERAYAVKADFIDWTECKHAWPWMQAHPGNYQHFTATGGKVDGHDPDRIDARKRPVGHDVVLSVRKDFKVIDHGYFFLAKEMDFNLKYHPERWGVWVVFEADGKTVLAIFGHPQPGATRNPKVAAEYLIGVRRLTRKLKALKKQYTPDLVISGGDLQLRSKVAKWIGPRLMFARLGMHYRNEGIDWLAWSKSWKRAGGHVLDLRKHFKGKLDHPWLVQTIKHA